MNKYKFRDIVIGEEGLLRGPFGSDLKKSLYVPKNKDAYKVYIQDNIFQKDENIGDYYISNDYFISKMKRYEVKQNDFIVTCDGTLGEIFQLKKLTEKGIISSSLLRITLNEEIVDPNYFYFLFKIVLKKKLITKGNNSVLKHLPGINIIKNLDIELPDLETQKKIGTTLINLEKKIEINNKINVKLLDYCQYLYNYYFLNDNKGVYNDKINLTLSQDWEVKKLSDILKKVPKTNSYKKDNYLVNGLFPIIDQSANFICGFCNDEKDLLNIDDCIVFGDHTKKLKYVNFKFARGADGTQIIISNDEKISNFLLYLQLKTMDLPNQGYSRYYKFLKEKYVFIPTKKENDNFMNLVLPMLNRIKNNIMENIELEKNLSFIGPLLICKK